MISSILLLVLIFQVKHFLADYPFQNEYMLGKFRERDWALPLFAHCAVHGLLTFCITAWFGLGQALIFAVFDICVHFIMDRIKADKKLLGRFKPLTAETYPTANYEQKKHNFYFWVLLGADQLVHHITDLVVVYWVLCSIYGLN